MIPNTVNDGPVPEIVHFIRKYSSVMGPATDLCSALTEVVTCVNVSRVVGDPNVLSGLLSTITSIVGVVPDAAVT